MVTKLRTKQERFVREYLVDQSPADAYVRAGYRAASRDVAWKASSRLRLLKYVEVKSTIAEAQVARMSRLELDADDIVKRFHLLYLEANHDGDRACALQALVNVAKLLGLYDRAKQRPPRYTMGDVERLKKELAEAGFDLGRLEPGGG